MNQTCSRCGFVNNRGINFCTNCGQSLFVASPSSAFHQSRMPSGRRILLIIGIIFMPYIFAWFTLRKGFPNIVRGLSFVWMILVFVLVASDKSRSQPEETASQPSAVTTTASASPSPSVAAATPAGTPQQPMEVLLATIDSGRQPRADDVKVARFKYLLTTIQGKTKNTKDQIGDMTVNSQRMLREKYGKEITLLELMEMTNRAMPEGSKQQWDYAEIVSMVIVLHGAS